MAESHVEVEDSPGYRFPATITDQKMTRTGDLQLTLVARWEHRHIIMELLNEKPIEVDCVFERSERT